MRKLAIRNEMNGQDNEIIRKKYVLLSEMIEADKLLSYLYQEDVLSQCDKEGIYALSTSKEKAEKLLDILSKRKDGLKMLIKALLISKVQGFLGNELLEIVTWSEEEMENFKLDLEGKIDRQQMLEANKAALKQENNQLKAKVKILTQKLEQMKAQVHSLKQEQEEKITNLTQEIGEKDDTIEMLMKELSEASLEELSERETDRPDSPRQARLTRTHAFKYSGKPLKACHQRQELEARMKNKYRQPSR